MFILHILTAVSLVTEEDVAITESKAGIDNPMHSDYLMMSNVG